MDKMEEFQIDNYDNYIKYLFIKKNDDKLYQHMYLCDDCGYSICINCAKICHRQHDVAYDGYKASKCSCPASDKKNILPSDCKVCSNRKKL